MARTHPPTHTFEQALALEPGNESAAAELQDLHTRTPLDGAAPPGMPPDGSPQRIAWDILSAVQSDTLYEAWSEHVDPALTDPLFEDASPAGRVRAEREFVRAVVEGYRQGLSSRMLGWELAEALSTRPEQEASFLFRSVATSEWRRCSPACSACSVAAAASAGSS